MTTGGGVLQVKKMRLNNKYDGLAVRADHV
jgi:hypothetical protein